MSNAWWSRCFFVIAFCAAWLVPGHARAEYSPEFGEYTAQSLAVDAFGEYSESTNIFSYSKALGDSRFGASLSASAYSYASKNATRKTTGARANFESTGTIFGHEFRALRAYGDAYTVSNPLQAAANVTAYFAGYRIYSQTHSSENIDFVSEPDLASLSYSKTIYLGGWLPVGFGAWAKGTGIFGAAGKMNGWGANLRFPLGGKFHIGAEATAGVDWIAEAFVEARLTLMEVVPWTRVLLAWEQAPEGNGCAHTLWKRVSAGADVVFMAGSVRGGARYDYYVTSGSYWEYISKWDGIRESRTLYDSGTSAARAHELATCPVVQLLN